MTTTWALVADRSRARIYANRGPGKGLTLVTEIQHPEGRLKDREIESSAAGRVFDRAGEARHAMEHTPAHAHIEEAFAKQLAQKLREGRVSHHISGIVLAAEPHFLGVLRKALDPDTTKIVKAELGKHLLGLGDGDVGEQLSAVMKL